MKRSAGLFLAEWYLYMRQINMNINDVSNVYEKRTPPPRGDGWGYSPMLFGRGGLIKEEEINGDM